MLTLRWKIEEGQSLPIVESIEYANTFWKRFWGWMGKRQVSDEQGIILAPCNAIHTFGMRFAIDVIFLDQNQKVLMFIMNVPPGRMLRCPHAHFVVELVGGTLDRLPFSISKGNQLIWLKNDDEPSTFI